MPDQNQTVEHQRRLNQPMKDVLKKEIIKWLDTTVIYPFADRSCICPFYCESKMEGMTIVPNERNNIIPIILVTWWRVCMDWQNMNAWTEKDHLLMPLMDQLLHRLVGKGWWCFLNGYIGHIEISIAPDDQEKTTFTCPYGTLAFKRMPFGLCNAPDTFHRCMISILSDMVEDTIEVLMDDFLVVGDSSDHCLSHLFEVLKRC